ncbi:MAG: DNA (cytosine-5-)-methyltransferase [candidate division Zixibacteria bacterium]|nr:DNA (cytosine-5-)-methyltransferase [candidate division Zixibacteria bacterium]MDH3936340.1 DNA (cytosine-5-)-methyltransferase [candidate division Zixibacteria bacterium]MDH4035178.1 DNA (cytosine-5-)-methyltransferase [candidate division Zixibacteria bacterium]
MLERIKHLAPGGKMGDLPEHLQHESFIRTGSKKTGGPNMRLLRLEMDKPSLTVTAYVFNKFVHPVEDRYITPREAACLQDFPDDWVFVGSLGEVHHQIGNAVPVNLAEALARSVAQFLEGRGIVGDVAIASYFCGAGGLDLGFERVSSGLVRFRTEFATDIDKACGNTIEVNRPSWNFFLGDITKFSGEAVLDHMGGNPVVVIGGPPCQPFSVAGKQKATTDPLGQLYRDYIEHVSILNPEVVILENVYGLRQVKSSNVLLEINSAFAGIGYQVKHLELLAADYGTPQMRRRLIFVATRGTNDFVFPTPTHSAEANIFGNTVYAGAGSSFAHLPEATSIDSLPARKMSLPLVHLRSLA